MWTKHDQQQQRQDFDVSIDWKASKTRNPFDEYDHESSSWEEQAFAEDAAAARSVGGCIWPPRSYSCSFCKREFRSAQALGGHMNVHRRDRARLKQQSTSNNPEIQINNIPIIPIPNPITFTSSSSPNNPNTYHIDPSYSEFDLKPEQHDKNNKGCVKAGLSDDRFDFDFLQQPQPTLVAMSDGEEEDAVKGSKRRKTDDSTTIQFYVVSSNNLVERNHRHHRRHRIQSSEVIGLSSTPSLHDLDLELRLGGLSKVE